jgi:predicted enzyme related to lactoylglutathione lyase
VDGRASGREAVLARAAALRGEGRSQESVALLAAELAERPDDAVRGLLALALVDTGREREAVALAVGALAAHVPDWTDRLRRDADALVEDGRRPGLWTGTTVLGVDDVRRALAFWSAALGYLPRTPPEDDWAVLVPASGSGARLALMLSSTPVQEHPRVHLDLYAVDGDAEIARLLALGATQVPWDSYPPDADFVVLADPSGNRFCVSGKGTDAVR